MQQTNGFEGKRLDFMNPLQVNALEFKLDPPWQYVQPNEGSIFEIEKVYLRPESAHVFFVRPDGVNWFAVSREEFEQSYGKTLPDFATWPCQAATRQLVETDDPGVYRVVPNAYYDGVRFGLVGYQRTFGMVHVIDDNLEIITTFTDKGFVNVYGAKVPNSENAIKTLDQVWRLYKAFKEELDATVQRTKLDELLELTKAAGLQWDDVLAIVWNLERGRNIGNVTVAQYLPLAHSMRCGHSAEEQMPKLEEERSKAIQLTSDIAKQRKQIQQLQAQLHAEVQANAVLCSGIDAANYIIDYQKVQLADARQEPKHKLVFTKLGQGGGRWYKVEPAFDSGNDVIAEVFLVDSVVSYVTSSKYNVVAISAFEQMIGANFPEPTMQIVEAMWRRDDSQFGKLGLSDRDMQTYSTFVTEIGVNLGPLLVSEYLRGVRDVVGFCEVLVGYRKNDAGLIDDLRLQVTAIDNLRQVEVGTAAFCREGWYKAVKTAYDAMRPALTWLESLPWYVRRWPAVQKAATLLRIGLAQLK